MAEPVRITFLGGLGEIGRNCACIEQAGRIVLIDCGIMFPQPDMPGIDLVLPDFTYLREHSGQVDAVVLTHGHEDHTGGLAYLLREMELTIYGSELTLGLAASRIEEAGLSHRARMVPVVDGERRHIGPFEVEFIPVTHSVPHGFAVAFRTAQGVILHSGDFKLDLTPVDGRRTNLSRIGSIAGSEGVRLLMADSTNAEEPGFTPSEREVGAALQRVLGAARGRRVIVTCFASHIHRVQQVVDAAVSHGRRIATLGRSMAKNVDLACRLGIMSVPDGALVDIERIDELPDGEVCVVSTGSQGEALSALALMAAGENKWVALRPGDLIVISAHPIPGNEWAVSRVIDGLYRRGADVIHTGIAPVHVSGHARQGELAILQLLTRPEWFVPVHGEYRHLVNHVELAQRTGLGEKKAILCEDGDSLLLDDEGCHRTTSVPAGWVYVDGSVGGVGHEVLRDRRVLAEEGVVVVVATVDPHARELVTKPEIITRGWVHAPEAEDLLDEASSAVRLALEEALAEGSSDQDVLRRQARRALGRFVGERTRRRPMIVPLVVTV